MPIKFNIASKKAKEAYRYQGGRKALEREDVVAQVWRSDGWTCKEMLQSSYQTNENFVPCMNGFLHSVIQAYNHHHHLIIRPDDLWTAILSQMNLYVNAHAEELRSKFVVHEGKKELEIITGGTRYTVDFGKLTQMMGELVKENIVDPSLHDWIIPNFSTTALSDKIVCSVMLMSTLKSYFSYKITLRCGIPSITLLGEKEDYISILKRVERLAEFGAEPAVFGRLLRPILQEFCDAFDAVALGEDPNVDFWTRTCHYQEGGSGPDYLGGWVAAFACWSDKGKWQGGNLEDVEKPLESEGTSRSGPPDPLVFSGLRYPVIDTGDIAEGFCEVDVKLDDNGEKFDCKMVAGHVGYTISATSEGPMDTLQPSSEWFIFIKGKASTETEAQTRASRMRA